MAKAKAKAAELTDAASGYRWPLPKLQSNMHLARDKLQCRVDFYNDTTVLFYLEEDGSVVTRVVNAQDITMALLREVSLNSGVLPQDTIFWCQSKRGVKVALWRKPQVWRVALQVDPFKPPRRFKLPMPGLVFVCQPGTAPYVYAAKKRPVHKKDILYHAPAFNVHPAGNTCAGTHKFPNKVSQIPESFFASHFTVTMGEGRSKKFPHKLLKLWKDIDGKVKYPTEDLVEFGPLEAIME